MAVNYYLHDGLVFYSYATYRAHFKNCPKCLPDYEAELAAGRAFGERMMELTRARPSLRDSDAVQ